MISADLLLAGRYQLRSRLGSGGHGEVWRAQDTLLTRVVAVKTVRAALADNPEFASRFHAEARSMATIEHRGVVSVFDFGIAETPGGRTPYLVMQYLDGEPLHLLLARRGRLAPATTMDLVAQAAEALQAAHEAGVVHRDVKPGNLMVRSDGTVVLTDFGIARTAEGHKLTASGIVLGTATYCAPEQAEGAEPTPAMDVYALGVVAYECLAGRVPFEGENAVAIALKHLNESPPPLPADLPAEVGEVVLRALAKDPAERWPSAAALATAARALADRLGAAGLSGSEGRAASPQETPKSDLDRVTGGRGTRRRALLAGSGLALAAIAATAVAWNVIGSTDPPPTTSTQARTGEVPLVIAVKPPVELQVDAKPGEPREDRTDPGTSPEPEPSADPETSAEPRDRPATGLLVGGIVHVGGPSPGRSDGDGYEPGVVEVLTDKGRRVASKRSGSSGFRFSLPQGRYRLQTAVGEGTCSTAAVVKQGETARADLRCAIPQPEPSFLSAAIKDASGDAKGGPDEGEAPAYADLLSAVARGGKEGVTAEFTAAGAIPTPSEGSGSTWSVSVEQDGRTAVVSLVGTKGTWSLQWEGTTGDEVTTVARPVISGARISIPLGPRAPLKTAPIDFAKPYQIVGASSKVIVESHEWTDSAP